VGGRRRTESCRRVLRFDQGGEARGCRTGVLKVGASVRSTILHLKHQSECGDGKDLEMDPTGALLEADSTSHEDPMPPSPPANRERGVRFLRHLYTEDQMEAMRSSWGKDFEWLTKDIVYGMFYGDDEVLETVDTELITYTAIVAQGLHVTVQNHLGGLLGMGLSLEEIEGVTECGKHIASWSGMYSFAISTITIFSCVRLRRRGQCQFSLPGSVPL